MASICRDRHANQRTGGTLGGLLQTVTAARARAVYGDPRRESAPPEKYRSLKGSVAARERRYKADAKVVCIGQHERSGK